jgi:NTE family protein
MAESSRAIVLGGGGVTGIAWEVGVLAGLHAAGIDLSADAVVGTSAGAFVGVALAGGADLEALYAVQQEPAEHESATRVPRRLALAWIWAFVRGRRDPEKIGAAFGSVARRFTPLVTAEERRRTVAARLGTDRWPPALRVTAIDAGTGALHVFDHTSGHALTDAVSASGAVPGISPIVTFGGRPWIDGGMVSSANALLAGGYERVLVIAPIAKGYGAVPSVAQDVETLRRTAAVELIVPDAAALDAIGPNRYDPARRPAAAAAGRDQGREAAGRVQRLLPPAP